MTSVRRLLTPYARLAVLLGFCALLTVPASAAEAAAAPKPAPAAKPEAVKSTAAPGLPAAPGFAFIDLPDWVLVEPPPRERKEPWILVIDDPQCPYCMQLHLAIRRQQEAEKRAPAGEPREISRALVARFPFPLPIHDQAAHIVTDALCIEATRDRLPWTAAGYLDWLMLDSWKDEPGLESATLEDLEKDGGLFDTKYDDHRVLASRRREFQMILVRKQAACEPGGCGPDKDCERLCAKQTECRAACPAESAAAPPAAAAENAGEEPPPTREECLDDCRGQFQSARYRVLARDHSQCVLAEGPGSAHGRTAAAFNWADEHDIPGTPTVYVGHPLIGWRLIGDADDLAGFFKLLTPALADARAALGKALGRPAGGA